MRLMGGALVWLVIVLIVLAFLDVIRQARRVTTSMKRYAAFLESRAQRRKESGSAMDE